MMLREEEVQSQLIGYYTPSLDEVRDGLRISSSSDYEVWGSVGMETGEIYRAAIIYDAQHVNGKTVLRADKLDADQVAELKQSGELHIAPTLANEAVLVARPGTVEALARDWHNIQDRRVSDVTRPVAIAGNSLVVEVQKGAKFGAPEMQRALDALGREDVDCVAVRVRPALDDAPKHKVALHR